MKQYLPNLSHGKCGTHLFVQIDIKLQIVTYAQAPVRLLQKDDS